MHFVIFAHDRSGSSSLAEALSIHPHIRVALDPFHPKYGQWHPDERTYRDSLTDVASLEALLDELSVQHNGIKVLSYDLPEEIYSHLLLLPDLKIIFLRRRNILQTVVSGAISEQTRMWQMWDPRFRREDVYGNLQPIDIGELKKALEYQIWLQIYYRRVVVKRPRDSRMFLNYEDFYTADLDQNRESLLKVLRFLGFGAADLSGADQYLDPRTAKLNNDDTYRMLPNAEEIDRALGSDKNGWLFDRRRSNRVL